MQPVDDPQRYQAPRAKSRPKPRYRDPAPSRTAYRLRRLWLKPRFRALLRIGLPVLAVALAVGGYLADNNRRDALLGQVDDTIRAVENLPVFRVRLMAIDGASAALADDIREVSALDFPLSSFDLDLQRLRDRVAGLDAVASVQVRLRAGGVLQMTVTERRPAMVWRSRDGVVLLDKVGHEVASVPARATRPDLPLITGDGAEKLVPQALAILAAAGPLKARIRGLERRGERRWDVVLNRNQRILLPQDAPLAALARVMVLNRTQDLLARNLSVIDMRNPRRPTLRLAPGAIKEFRVLSALQTGDTTQ